MKQDLEGLEGSFTKSVLASVTGFLSGQRMLATLANPSRFEGSLPVRWEKRKTKTVAHSTVFLEAKIKALVVPFLFYHELLANCEALLRWW